MTTQTTAHHEMDKRIRFGSDGNGIFVAVSRDAGKTWRHYDDEHALARTGDALPSDELRAGILYLRGEWYPSQKMPVAA